MDDEVDLRYGWVVPWSGEVIVPPIEPPPPLPITAPDLPAPGNPIPVIVHGAQYAWDDVWSWTKDAWHGITSLWGGEASLTRGLVENLVEQAMATVQTAWSSFISQLEHWIGEAVSVLGAEVAVLGIDTILNELGLWDSVAGIEGTLWGVFWPTIQGIEGRIDNLEVFIPAAIDLELRNLRTWVIDDIASPLLKELARAEQEAAADTLRGVKAAEDYARDLVDSETLRRIAAVAGVAAIVAAITTWIDSCGEPMCEEFGPRTNLGKLLGNLELQALLALLLTLALGDPKAVADATERIVELFGPSLQTVIEDWLVPLQAATPG